MRIVVHPEPVRVSYETVRALVPGLLDGHVDVAVHVGMAGPRPLYHLERRAHRIGYATPDVDGCTPGAYWHGGLPDELETDLDLDDVLKRWRARGGAETDLRLSDDVGRFLCDFLYYSTLAMLQLQRRPRRAVFLHVPCDASERRVSEGRKLLLDLIRAIAESEAAREKGDA